MLMNECDKQLPVDPVTKQLHTESGGRQAKLSFISAACQKVLQYEIHLFKNKPDQDSSCVCFG